MKKDYICRLITFTIYNEYLDRYQSISKHTIISPKSFDIRKGELNRALLMQLNIFLIITTLLIVKPAVNDLFLARFGAAHLPNAFIQVAIISEVAIKKSGTRNPQRVGMPPTLAK